MTRQITVGGLKIGGGAPVSIQSMLNIPNTNIDGCLEQIEALRRAGAVCDTETRGRVTKADLAALGLSGGADSAARRKALQKKLALPENLSANALLDAVNSLYTRDEFLSAARSFEHEGRGVAEQEKAAGGGLKLGGEPVESIGARRELSDM